MKFAIFLHFSSKKFAICSCSFSGGSGILNSPISLVEIFGCADPLQASSISNENPLVKNNILQVLIYF